MIKLILILACTLTMSSSFAAQSQKYKVTFESLWNKTDHLSVPGRAHFSPIVAISHTSAFKLLPVGFKANKALERVAELGDAAMINQVIARQKNMGHIGDSLNTKNQFIKSQKTQIFELMVYDSAPLLSFVTMIAPSPDWVVGISSLELYDMSSGFSGKVTRDLYALDAGTENGDFGGNFSLRNSATKPQKRIRRLFGKGFRKPFARVTIEPIN